MPTQAPLVISVVTACLNSEQTIRETIESVRTQDYSAVEHIVMDGGSKDDTLKILAGYPHLRVFSEKDEGHYHAMNLGIERARGDVVGILNADDYYRPGALSAIAASLAQHSDWEGLFGDFVFVDGQGHELYRRKEAIFDYDTMRYAFGYICHPALFVKKEIYQKFGAYRYKSFKNLCDYDFILRIAKARCKIGTLHQFIVNFRYHDFGQSLDKRVIRNFERETWEIKKEHGVPGGFAGQILHVYGHARRQMQKLIYRGTCDIYPARWLMRRHMRERTTFSSNIGIDKLS